MSLSLVTKKLLIIGAALGNMCRIFFDNKPRLPKFRHRVLPAKVEADAVVMGLGKRPAQTTHIEWTHTTDNIIVAGFDDHGTGELTARGWWCRKRSTGCGNCFSATMNQNNFWGGNHLAYSGDPPKLILKTDIIQGWAHQRLPRRHFVSSMTDIFGEWLDPAWIEQFLDGMVAAPLQTFQLLSKREDVMYSRAMFWLEKRKLERVPSHILLGHSVENQEMADLRIPWLLKIPGRHFLSIEPLIAPVDLSPWLNRAHLWTPESSIDWVIVGGETGKGSRPMHPDWVRNLRDQCVGAGIPFFFKQWGNYHHIEPELEAAYLLASRIPKKHLRLHDSGKVIGDGDDLPEGNTRILKRVRKQIAGLTLDGAIWNQFPPNS